jgi:hypothetical protein
MLNVALSQVELRSIPFTTLSTFNLVVGISGFNNILYTSPIVTGNEQWLFSAGGLRLVFDDTRITVTGGACFITTVDGLSMPIPTGFVNGNSSASGAWVGISLQGIVLPPGSSCGVVAYLANSDGAAAHNVTSGFANMLVQPLRLMTDIETVQLTYQRAQSGLDARLRSSRG